MRIRTGAFVALATAAVLVGTVPAATATAKAVPIGPKQLFAGMVNGHGANAVIIMACPLPLTPGERGHPVGTQTVAVEPPATTAQSTGDTGSLGDAVVASFVTSSAAGSDRLTFTRYRSMTIPPSFLLPCSGKGSVIFAPSPTSRTARAAVVDVTYGNVSTSAGGPAG